MNRAPIAAWRNLLAAGGAPAASHAALARVPVRERLLAPLAESSLVREGRFAALVRPVEFGGGLGKRIANAGAATDVPSDGLEAVESRESRMSQEQVAGHVRRSGHGAPGDGGSVGSERTGRRRPISSREPRPSRAVDLPRVANGGVPRSAPSSGIGTAGARSKLGVGELSFTAPPRQRVPLPLAASEATDGAARTPVVVAPASPSILRLLDAASAPAPAGATRRDEPDPGSLPSTSAHASALERVLARLSERRASRDERTGGAPTMRGASPLRAAASDAPALSRRALDIAGNDTPANGLQRILHAPSTSTDVGSGGFRGLATRALRQSDGALPAVASPAPTLTHEVRTISDLPVDALDASVADSVTRILQREARRHGIDLAGTGT